ncbi:hypothetical protein ABBQ32_012428 [Trebouxia sp. C0010 RCD-2024]
MQCFGGLFRPRAPQRDSHSVAGAPGHALSTSGQGLAATGSSASCATPVLQHSTETSQQSSNSTFVEPPVLPESVPHSPHCNDSTASIQQRRAQQDVADPIPAGVSMGASASTYQVSNAPETALEHDYSATQPSVLTAATLISVPPEPAAHENGDMEPKSAVAKEACTALRCTAGTSASSVASLQAGFNRATHPGNMKTQQEDCRVSPGYFQPAQQDSLCKQASVGDANSCQGGSVTEGNFSWEPRARYSKASSGQHKKDIRASLDWDFQNEMPVVNTRRSKEYGEHTLSRSCAGRGAGRT